MTDSTLFARRGDVWFIERIAFIRGGKEGRDCDVHRVSRARRPKKRTVSRKRVAADMEEKEEVVEWKDSEKREERREDGGERSE